MDSHRSFEFDRYPFDDAIAAESDATAQNERQAYPALDVTHGDEVDLGSSNAAAHRGIPHSP